MMMTSSLTSLRKRLEYRNDGNEYTLKHGSFITPGSPSQNREKPFRSDPIILANRPFGHRLAPASLYCEVRTANVTNHRRSPHPPIESNR